MKKTTSKISNNETAKLLLVISSLLEKESLQSLTNHLKNRLEGLDRASQKDMDLITTESRDLQRIVDELISLDSRELGLTLLTTSGLSRKEFESIGRILGLPIMRTDNIDRLTQKIIEASIGSRLNSKAIRGV